MGVLGIVHKVTDDGRSCQAVFRMIFGKSGRWYAKLRIVVEEDYVEIALSPDQILQEVFDHVSGVEKLKPVYCLILVGNDMMGEASPSCRRTLQLKSILLLEKHSSRRESPSTRKSS